MARALRFVMKMMRPQLLRTIVFAHALLTGLLTAAVGCGSVSPLNADGGSAGTGGGGRDAAMTTGNGGQSGQAGTTGQGGDGGVARTGTGGQGGAAGVSGAGSCNTDSDCVYRPGSCCDGTCAAKTDPLPPPGPMCNIACPALVPSCGCVNHQCATAPACAPSGGGACQFCPNGYLTGPGGCQTCECKPGDAGVDGSTSGCLTTDTLPTDPAALHIYQLAQSDEHARLHGVVGQYVCGESPLYRGTFMASDNLGSIEPGATDGVVTGSVIASLQTIVEGQVFLTCDTVVPGGRALVVVSGSGAEARGVRLFQQSSDGKTTYASMVSSPMSTWSGTSGACDGCVADLLGDAPASIDVVATVFKGQYCGGSSALQVSAGGHVTILQSPSWGDIIAFNQDVGATLMSPTFVLQGTDEVATVDGSVYEPATSTSGLSCNLLTPYHVDWYVNQQNLKLHGLRNFRIGPSQTVCRSPV